MCRILCYVINVFPFKIVVLGENVLVFFGVPNRQGFCNAVLIRGLGIMSPALARGASFVLSLQTRGDRSLSGKVREDYTYGYILL